MARSKRYQQLAKKVEISKIHTLDEAVAVLQETATTKFKASVELHVRVCTDPTKGDQQVRGTVALPHGSGKTVKIAAFAEGEDAKAAKEAGADIVGGAELIDELKKTGKINFDIAIATPEIMRNLAQVAKVLGPKGLMPSPKNETVTKNMAKTIAELKKGKIAFKNDDTSNIHLMIGKADFSPEQLKENFLVALDAIRKAKPATSKGTYLKNITVNATMGPGIKVTTA